MNLQIIVMILTNLTTKSSKMKSQINYSDESYSDSSYDSNSDYNSD